MKRQVDKTTLYTHIKNDTSMEIIELATPFSEKRIFFSILEAKTNNIKFE
jgi:hypothetical protein